MTGCGLAALRARVIGAGKTSATAHFTVPPPRGTLALPRRVLSRNVASVAVRLSTR
jgi:hypothetical protein